MNEINPSPVQPVQHPKELLQAYQQALLNIRELAALHKTERTQREELEATNERLRLALNEAIADLPADSATHVAEIERLRQELDLAQKQNLVYAADLAKSYTVERTKTRALAKTEEQLNRSAKLAKLGQMVAAIAHDVNNMIAPVNAYSQLLLMIPTLPDNAKTYAGRILQAAERSVAMLKSLTNFGSNRPLKRTTVIVETIVQSVVTLLEQNLSRQRVKIILDFDPALPYVKADQAQLEQVLLNLLINAQHAMEPQGGEIRISVHAVENGIRLSISDQGHGIPAEIQKQLFEPFFTTKENGKGTGLGLFICHDIIERHGGTIDVISTVGSGTTFLVTLPAAEQIEELAEAPTI